MGENYIYWFQRLLRHACTNSDTHTQTHGCITKYRQADDTLALAARVGGKAGWHMLGEVVATPDGFIFFFFFFNNWGLFIF